MGVDASVIRRYTELPFLIQMLITKKITLLNSDTWDDKNDAYSIERYKEKKEIKTVLALCMTNANETYHHWVGYAKGTSGACLIFDKDKLMTWIKENGLKGAKTVYRKIQDAENEPPKVEDYPFFKRFAFEDEDEFRIIYENKDRQESIKSFSFDLGMIREILLNPWLPIEIGKTIKAQLRAIEGCKAIKVTHSRMLESDRWKRVFK